MIKLSIVGDFMPIDWLEESILKNETQDLLDLNVRQLLKESDLNIINLECPLTESNTTILKTGKCFKAKPGVVHFLKEHNFKLACLANNHIMDYGEQGLLDTVQVCKEQEINTIGIVDKQEASNTIYRFEKNGIALSIINAAEQEFGASEDGGIGYILEAPEVLFGLIQQEKQAGRKVLLILHGGREFFNLPTLQRQARYRLYIDMGAEAIISHHTHVPSGIEYYEGKPIVYSVGNFMFPFQNHSDKRWYQSIIASLEITENKVECNLYAFHFSQTKKKLLPLTSEQQAQFDTDIKALNETILDKRKMYEAWLEHCKQEAYSYLSMMNFFTRFRYKLYLKGLLKAPTIDQKKLIVMLNLLRCEAHRIEATDIIKRQLKEHKTFIN